MQKASEAPVDLEALPAKEASSLKSLLEANEVVDVQLVVVVERAEEEASQDDRRLPKAGK